MQLRLFPCHPIVDLFDVPKQRVNILKSYEHQKDIKLPMSRDLLPVNSFDHGILDLFEARLTLFRVLPVNESLL